MRIFSPQPTPGTSAPIAPASSAMPSASGSHSAPSPARTGPAAWSPSREARRFLRLGDATHLELVASDAGGVEVRLRADSVIVGL